MLEFNKDNFDKLLGFYLKAKFTNNLNTIKAKCEREGIPFAISIDDLLPLPTECPVFGTPLDYFKEGGGPSNSSPTVDRLIPELGYVPGNVRVISCEANRLKNNATIEQLDKIIRYMKSNNAV